MEFKIYVKLKYIQTVAPKARGGSMDLKYRGDLALSGKWQITNLLSTLISQVFKLNRLV